MTLARHKQQRSTIKRNITRIKTVVEEKEDELISQSELKCRLSIVEAYFKQALNTQSLIEELDDEDTGRTDLEELYIQTKLAIQSKLGEEVNTTVSAAENTCLIHVPTQKLPQLKLPTFSGKYSEYKNFITSFSQIIDKEINLSNIEKFNHLRNCLQGQALETVNAFQTSNENYPKALARLKERYDNSTLIFLENITSLFELPSVSTANGTLLRRLVDNASALYGSLSSLGSEKQISHSMLIHLVMLKVDEQTRKKWKESLTIKELPTWESCTSVLERHCQYLESIESTGTQRVDNLSSSKIIKSSKHTKGYSFTCSSSTCVICLETNHKVYSCPKFKNMDVALRFEHAKKHGLCINCLGKGHQLTKCPSSHRCKDCSRQHHSLLHRPINDVSGSQHQVRSAANNVVHQSTSLCLPSTSRETITHNHIEKCQTEHIILATATILIRDNMGSYQIARALLDSCSQMNFVPDDLSQRLKLARGKHNIEVHSIGNASTNIKYKVATTIRSCHSGFELPLTFCVISNIAHQPEETIDITTWNIPGNIELADNHFQKPTPVDVLLGTETFFSLLSVGQIKLGKELTILQKTLLGWIVSGRYTRSAVNQSSQCCFVSNKSLNDNLEYLWKLEEFKSSYNGWTREHNSCERHFVETVEQNPDGRLVVRIPFKDDPSSLGHSYETSLRRFMSQERRLLKQPELMKQYIVFMMEYEDLGHVSLVKSLDLNKPYYIIPHHCVLKPSSTSTKLKVVFDASCRTTTSQSLNYIQMVGPTIQSELFVLLLRFRTFRYALTADIVKMYRQILIAEEHRRYQYIFWRCSPAERVNVYQLNTITYGMAASPFLAIRSLHYLADKFVTKYSVASQIVKSSFYVDDLLCGANSVEELTEIKNEVTGLLKEGCFKLAKWHSNHKECRDERSNKELTLESDSVTSTLGMTWDQANDYLLFSFRPKRLTTSTVTKRAILSIASSLFDLWVV